MICALDQIISGHRHERPTSRIVIMPSCHVESYWTSWLAGAGGGWGGFGGGEDDDFGGGDGGDGDGGLWDLAKDFFGSDN